MRKRDFIHWFIGGLSLTGCGDRSTSTSEQPDDEPAPPAGATEFVSTILADDAAASGNENAAKGDAVDDASSSDDGAVSDEAGAERAITEADIIQVDGDRLFALSQFSGLTIVDISDPLALSVEGKHKVSGTPFEMYRNNGVIVAMFNAYGRYIFDEEAQQTRWVESSRVQAVDVSKPNRPEVLGDLKVPGSISDSRLVGNILYLVTTEYGCWGCSAGPSTVVTSFDLSDLSAIKEVDQLRFEEPEQTYLGQRSITVTPERIYIGGRDWNWDDSGDTGSRIQVVDIADPSGDLIEGATLPIAGHIDSRWQMDEYDGTLRVLSQWETWRSDSPPALETYRVHSASNIEPLARLNVELPRPEILQSVRFDGDRAYAITFERTDPLFTFDLSDPTTPLQVGELEIPGWVYHMEPRGDRLYAIGFDQDVANASLHVSLFDVAKLNNPTMLDRVNFGGDWGSFAEDQDRIHKSFQLLSQGFMVVPFSGWDYDEQVGCNTTYHSGIQLVDYTRDDLTLRGVAPQLGSARRAFVHDGYLFGIGDDAVQTFDISDRDAITKLDTLETARNISTVRIVGDQVLRFGTDWWTDRSVLDVTKLKQAADPSPLTPLDLATLIDTEDQNSCNGYAYWGNAYVHDDYAYVSRTSYNWDNYNDTEKLEFFVVDLAAAGGPALVGKFAPEALKSGDREYAYFGGVVQTEGALLVQRTRYNYSQDYNNTTVTHSYEVFDLSNPAKPTSTTVFELPASLIEQGWGRYAGGCGVDLAWGWGGYWGGYGSESTALVSGHIVASSHVEPLADDPTRGKYYLDRIDLSDPADPQMLAPVNVPGRVLYYAHDEGRILTLDEKIERLELAQEACWERSGPEPTVSYNWQDEGHCQKTERSLHWLSVHGDIATLAGSVPVDVDNWYMSTTTVSDERVFVELYQPRLVQEEWDNQTYDYWVRGTTRLVAFDGELNKITEFERSSEDLDYWSSQLRARGNRAFLTNAGELTVFDTTDPNAPQSYKEDLNGYGCESLEVRGKHLLCAQGKQGVELVELR